MQTHPRSSPTPQRQSHTRLRPQTRPPPPIQPNFSSSHPIIHKQTLSFTQMTREDFQASLTRALQAARSLDKHSDRASTAAMIPKIAVFALSMLARRGVTEDAVLSAMVRKQYPEHGKQQTRLPDDLVEALLREIDSDDEDDETIKAESQNEDVRVSDVEVGEKDEERKCESVTIEGSPDGERVTTVG